MNINNQIQRRYFNSSSLDINNYTVYANGTVSNGTDCYLNFGSYKPTLFNNGTFYNATTCDSPIYPIKARGAVGMAWGILLILSIPVSLYNLQKYGKGDRSSGWKYKRKCRKWQWYWLILLETCGAIAGFFSIDLDRDYIPGSSLKLYSAFYSAVLPLALCTVWEVCQYWQYLDEVAYVGEDYYTANLGGTLPFAIRLTMSFIFYSITLLSFILTLLTNLNHWPISIDLKWKVGVYFAFMSWIQTSFFIAFILYFSKQTKFPPLHILVSQLLILVLLCYHLTFIWNEMLAPFQIESATAFLAIMGYLPVLLLALLLNVNGLLRTPPGAQVDNRIQDGIPLIDLK